MVGARKNIRRQSASPNILSIWRNPRQKKSWRTLHQTASPTKWDTKTWMSKARNLTALTLENYAWMTGLSKQPGKSTMKAWKPLKWLVPRFPHRSLLFITVIEVPSPRRPPSPQTPTRPLFSNNGCVSYRKFRREPVCWCPGHQIWILGGTAREADHLEKTAMKGKRLRDNMGQTKVLISGLNVLHKSVKDDWAVYLQGISTNSRFCGGCYRWVHRKCSGISGSLKPDLRIRSIQCTGQARPVYGDQWQRSPWVGKILRWCLPSATLGTVYPQEAVVNSLPSQDVEGQIQWAPAHPPSRSFPITSRGRVCSLCIRSAMLHKRNIRFYLICIACNAMTRLWSAGKGVSPPRTKSARKIFWGGCSLTILQKHSIPFNSDRMAMWNVGMVDWRMYRNPVSCEVVSVVGLKNGQKWSTWTA